MNPDKIKRFLNLSACIVTIAVASFVVFFLAILIALQFSSVQTWLTGKVTDYVSQRVETRFTVERVAIRFPKSIGLKGVYAEDQSQDTLLYAGSIFVDVGMLALLRNSLNIKGLELENAVFKMNRHLPDTTFNFQYLIDAFSKPSAAQQQPVTLDTAPSKPWKVNIGKVSLKKIRFAMADHLTGVDLMVDLGKFFTDLASADLFSEKYLLGETSISDIFVGLMVSDVPEMAEDDSTTPAPLPQAGIEKLKIENIHFLFANPKGTKMEISGGLLQLESEKFNLPQNNIALKTLMADNIVARFEFPDSVEESKIKENQQPFSFDFTEIMPWDITINELKIKQSGLILKQDNRQPTNSFNPGHLNLANIHFEAENIQIAPHTVRIEITDATVDFSEQFSITRLQGQISIGTSTLLNIRNMQTRQSRMSLRIESHENMLQFSENLLWEIPFRVTFNNTHLQSDLAWLVPEMNSYWFGWRGNTGIRLFGSLSGTPANINADSISVEGPGFFGLSVSGRIAGLPHTSNLSADIPSLRVFANPLKVISIMPDSLKPSGIEMPNMLLARTSLRGSLSDFNARTDVRTDLGNILMDIALTSQNPEPVFQAHILASDLNLGKLTGISESISESLDIEASFKGTGLSLQTTKATGQAEIKGFVFNNYHYGPIKLGLTISDSIASLNTAYNDEKLSFLLDGRYGLAQKNPIVGASVKLDYAFLKDLGLSKNEMLIKTVARANLHMNLDDFFTGSIIIENSALATEGKVYEIPSFVITTIAEPQRYEARINSSFINTIYTGSISPLAVWDELQYLLPENYGPDTDKPVNPGNPHFNLHLSLNPDDFVTEILIPPLATRDTLKFTALYEAAGRLLDVQLNWNALQYGNTALSDLKGTITERERETRFNIKASKLALGELLMTDAQLIGSMAESKIELRAKVNNTQGNALYALGMEMKAVDSIYQIRFVPHQILINGMEWDVSPKNLIRYGKNFLHIDALKIQKQQKFISLATSMDKNENPLLNLELQGIDMAELIAIMPGEPPPVEGILNGKASVLNIFNQPAFIAVITIDGLAWQGDTLGNVTIKADANEPGIYNLQAGLTGNLTQLTLSGNYTTGDEPDVDMELELTRLDLSSLKGFTGGQVTHLGGNVAGRVKVSGKMATPLFNGDLQFNQATFRVPAINAGYFLRNERVVFDRQNICFQHVNLEDSAGRRAAINGSINIADLNQLVFNVDLSSRNFLLLNVRPGQNELYHGRILVDSDLRLRGNQSTPLVEGTIKLNEGSNFTYTIPQSNPEAIGSEGIVEFITHTDTLFYRLASQTAPAMAMMSAFERIEANINMEIDPKTDVKIIIDPFAGDFLEVVGGGTLSFGIDPGGRISLSGRYELVDGEYLLTFYDVIRRNFTIQQGSSIVWSGDPLNATVDITAIHTLRTNARDLMMTQSGNGQMQSALLRQQFPFQVFLKMKGILSEPDISFEITLPPEHRNALDGNIMARLNQINQNESELNKQVFALLILGNFLQENPLASLPGGGDGFASTARTSASQVLTQQLNRLSDRFIRGVDINFEVESFVDFTDGQGTGRTELQIEVSRNFFDERVRVTVGGNIELEDETRRQTNAADIAGDFTLEYLLTPDGNLRLRGFRAKNYAGIFDGQVTETGISLLFSRSFNRFRDLFKKEDEVERIDTITE